MHLPVLRAALGRDDISDERALLRGEALLMGEVWGRYGEMQGRYSGDTGEM